jgi:hypothetical protein
MSSRTSSQSKLAKAWMHFPGHSLESAVFVIVPRRPEKIVVTVYAFFTNIAVVCQLANSFSKPENSNKSKVSISKNPYLLIRRNQRFSKKYF